MYYTQRVYLIINYLHSPAPNWPLQTAQADRHTLLHECHVMGADEKDHIIHWQRRRRLEQHGGLNAHTEHHNYRNRQ